MATENIIPFKRDIRSEIEIEWEIAFEKFGEDHIEVMGIASSWGDTMDDEQVLAALRKLNSTGSMFDDITIRADDRPLD
jgi:hypothetical protein